MIIQRNEGTSRHYIAKQTKSNQIKSNPAISTIPMVTKLVGFRPTGLLQIVKWRCVMFSFYPAITNGIVRI